MKRGRRPAQAPLQVTNGRPQPPASLTDPIALEAWWSVCEDLEKEERLCMTDAKLIEIYARTYAIWFRIDQQLAKEELKTSKDVREFINPLIPSHNSYTARLSEVLCKLKLTPFTRGRHAKKPVENPDAGILKFID